MFRYLGEVPPNPLLTSKLKKMPNLKSAHIFLLAEYTHEVPQIGVFGCFWSTCTSHAVLLSLIGYFSGMPKFTHSRIRTMTRVPGIGMGP